MTSEVPTPAPPRRIRGYPNLRPWPKGVSGHPEGRPRKTGPDLKDWVEFATQSADGRLDQNGAPTYTRDDAVMKTLYLICINQRHRDVVQAIKVWLERTRGKTPDKVELGGRGDFSDEENPITAVLEVLLAKAKQREAAAKAATKGQGKGRAKTPKPSE